MKYKTYEELKEELGDKYDKYMYEINLELMKKIDRIKKHLKSKDFSERFQYESDEKLVRIELLEILGDPNE